MYVKMISAGQNVGPEEWNWHCLVGQGPKGYNCIPLGIGPSS